jgi:hypothetical protein
MVPLLVALVAGCYNPSPPAGAPCSLEGTCPSGLDCIDGRCVPPGTAGEPDAAIDARVDAAIDAPPDAFVDVTLVAYWNFDDTPADGALDSSGRGHTATCIGACPTLVPGKNGNGYRFDPDQSHALTVPDSPDFRGNYTLAAWIYADVNNLHQAVMSKPVGAVSANSWQLELLTTAKLSVSGGTTHYLENPATTAVATWYHVAGTWDGTTKRLYVNGVLVASVASTTTYDTSIVVLGADQNTGSTVLYWDGILDDVRIYNRALTLQELQAFAN